LDRSGVRSLPTVVIGSGKTVATQDEITVNAKSMKNLKTALAGNFRKAKAERRASYYDPFFADPETVEDDYHRLKGGRC
jgi:hypothetical protein